MLRYLLPAIGLLLYLLPVAAQIPQEEELKQKLLLARNDEERIANMGKLAELYAVFRDYKRADSLLVKQMLLAEMAQNDTLLVQTVCSAAVDNVATWSNTETFERTTAFLQKALTYAKERNNTELEVVVYLKLASLFRKRQLHDRSIEQISLAFVLLNSKQDSLKAALYLELGEAFSGKGDAVSAYQNFNNAYDIAYALKNVPLQSTAWHAFSNLYRELGDTLLAKNALYESVNLNRAHGNKHGLLTDYIDLSRLTEEHEFLDRAFVLANELKSVKDQLQCKRLLFSYIMVVEKNSSKALAYLEQNPDLALFRRNRGLPNYNLGAIYHYGGDYAKAVHFYQQDEQLVTTGFEPSVQLSFFRELADCFYHLKQSANAINYYEKALAISRQYGSAFVNASLTDLLSQLYGKNKDFQKAYSYSRLHEEYNETLKRQAKQREVTLLGLEREKKKHERDLQAAASEETRRRNLQYTGISLAIAFLFIILILIGMFPVHKFTIRMLNFVSFICLFEFIILLIDNWLHHLTHGQPLQIWLAKIVIIALLLPLHHWLEHIAIKFLSSQKLQQFRQKISVRKFFHPSKKTVEKIEENLEQGTLV